MITHLKGTARKRIAKKLGYKSTNLRTMVITKNHFRLKGWYQHQLLVLHKTIDICHIVTTSTKNEVETWLVIKLLKP